MSRAQGPGRRAIVAQLQAGAQGTYEDFARLVGLPAPAVSKTLRHLACHGGAAVIKTMPRPQGQGRPRAVYALVAQSSVDALAHVRQAWR